MSSEGHRISKEDSDEKLANASDVFAGKVLGGSFMSAVHNTGSNAMSGSKHSSVEAAILAYEAKRYKEMGINISAAVLTSKPAPSPEV